MPRARQSVLRSHAPFCFAALAASAAALRWMYSAASRSHLFRVAISPRILAERNTPLLASLGSREFPSSSTCCLSGTTEGRGLPQGCGSVALMQRGSAVGVCTSHSLVAVISTRLKTTPISTTRRDVWALLQTQRPLKLHRVHPGVKGSRTSQRAPARKRWCLSSPFPSQLCPKCLGTSVTVQSRCPI